MFAVQESFLKHSPSAPPPAAQENMDVGMLGGIRRNATARYACARYPIRVSVWNVGHRFDLGPIGNRF